MANKSIGYDSACLARIFFYLADKQSHEIYGVTHCFIKILFVGHSGKVSQVRDFCECPE
jgi:hypothetical protein